MENNSDINPSLRDTLFTNQARAEEENAARKAPGTAASNQGIALSDFHINLCNETANLTDPELQRDFIYLARRFTELGKFRKQTSDKVI